MKWGQIQSEVLEVLQNDEKARSDDFYLYFQVAKKHIHVPSADDVSFKAIAYHHNELPIPSYESVSRTRRKLQAKFPELRNSETVRHRKNKEAEFVAYARADI